MYKTTNFLGSKTKTFFGVTNKYISDLSFTTDKNMKKKIISIIITIITVIDSKYINNDT